MCARAQPCREAKIRQNIACLEVGLWKEDHAGMAEDSLPMWKLYCQQACLKLSGKTKTEENLCAEIPLKIANKIGDPYFFYVVMS